MRPHGSIRVQEGQPNLIFRRFGRLVRLKAGGGGGGFRKYVKGLAEASWPIMRKWKMTEGSIRRLEDTAQHEAGHAIAAVVAWLQLSAECEARRQQF